MPVVSIGTGGQETSSAENITEYWLQLGGRGVDTAQVYRNQASVATALAKVGVPRKDVFITTKIWGCAMVDNNVKHDLQQLGTDYIDLLLIHVPKFGDCAVAWKILEGYFARGVLKAIGVSNFKKADLQHILKNASVVPHVNQIQLNVLEHDDETISFSSANKIAIEAYSPIGRNSSWIRTNSDINAIGAKHNVSTYQVAMKWILQHGHMLTFQSSSKKHQQEDADLFNFNLSSTEMATLDSLQSASAPMVV
jgi:diketogulonate reductase-like aldo/keto reductase